MDKVIIDTSVWIESLRPQGDAELGHMVRDLILNGRVLLPGIIKVELLRGAKNKKEYIATIQFLSLSMILLKFIYLSATIGISKQAMKISPFGVITSVFGMILGMFVFDKLPHKTINRIVYVIMAVAGIWYVVR